MLLPLGPPEGLLLSPSGTFLVIEVRLSPWSPRRDHLFSIVSGFLLATRPSAAAVVSLQAWQIPKDGLPARIDVSSRNQRLQKEEVNPEGDGLDIS